VFASPGLADLSSEEKFVSVESPGFDFDRSKLTPKYDVARLQQEVSDAIRGFPPYVHYNVIPLIGAGQPREGVTDYSDPDWTTWVAMPILGECPYISEILDSLECRKTSVRLLRIEPGGELREHTDPQLDLDHRNQVRLHVPVFTNEQVEFLLNGTAVPLEEGELWYLRLSDPHSVVNQGPTERVQLSIDVVVNDWVIDRITEGVK
jgi:hypothetical protein